MNFIDSLNEQSRKRWPRIYKAIKKRVWKPPEKDKRGIQCETKIESIEEIDKFMRQKPNPTERK